MSGVFTKTLLPVKPAGTESRPYPALIVLPLTVPMLQENSMPTEELMLLDSTTVALVFDPFNQMPYVAAPTMELDLIVAPSTATSMPKAGLIRTLLVTAVKDDAS
jgi:hypothetical protein